MWPSVKLLWTVVITVVIIIIIIS